MTSNIEYPLLRTFERQSSFPYVVGADQSLLKALHNRLTRANSMRGVKQLRAEITAAAKDIRDHIEWLNKATLAHEAEDVAREQARKAADRPTRGGPTEAHPDAPYCKPDQSCCDFTCGN